MKRLLRLATHAFFGGAKLPGIHCSRFQRRGANSPGIPTAITSGQIFRMDPGFFVVMIYFGPVRERVDIGSMSLAGIVSFWINSWGPVEEPSLSQGPTPYNGLYGGYMEPLLEGY